MRSIKMKLRAATYIAILCLTLTPPAQAQLTVGTGGSVAVRPANQAALAWSVRLKRASRATVADATVTST